MFRHTRPEASPAAAQARPAGTFLLDVREDHERDYARIAAPAGVGDVHLGDGEAVRPAGGEVEQDVGDAAQGQALERLGELRADALEALDGGEQRIEEIGPHR